MTKSVPSKNWPNIAAKMTDPIVADALITPAAKARDMTNGFHGQRGQIPDVMPAMKNSEKSM